MEAIAEIVLKEEYVEIEEDVEEGAVGGVVEKKSH